MRIALPILAYLALLAVPLAFDAGLDLSELAYDAGGSCERLTDAGRHDLAVAVLPLRLSLLAWMLIGAGALALLWWRRLEGSPARGLTVGIWCLAAAATVLPIWLGPAADGIGKAALIVLYTPVVLLLAAILMAIAATRRRDGERPPFPAAVYCASLALLLVAMVAGGWLGGSGEVLLC